MEITQEFLRKRFDYNPITGEIIYRYRTGPLAKEGQVAGTVTKNGYLSIQVLKKRIYVHRLIWIYMTGDIPNEDVDHIDGVRTNNQWSNLRLASRQQNMFNKPGKSSSGIKGVYFVPKTSRWVAELRIDRKRVYQEYFATLDAAAQGIRINRIRLHGEFANHTNEMTRG